MPSGLDLFCILVKDGGNDGGNDGVNDGKHMEKLMDMFGYVWICLECGHVPCHSLSFFDMIEKAIVLLHLGWCWKSKGPMLLDSSGSLVAIRGHRTHFLGFTWQAFYDL